MLGFIIVSNYCRSKQTGELFIVLCQSSQKNNPENLARKDELNFFQIRISKAEIVVTCSGFSDKWFIILYIIHERQGQITLVELNYLRQVFEVDSARDRQCHLVAKATKAVRLCDVRQVLEGWIVGAREERLLSSTR